MNVRVKVKVNAPNRSSALRAFTMIEIAIALAVIGFALVAIIGILPMGLNVQKDNREDTIVNQDGAYLMDLIRFGRQGKTQDQGKALDFLTNYVESVTIKKETGSKSASKTFSLTQNNMTNGQTILDLLCTPRYEAFGDPRGGSGMYTNTVTASIRGMTGSALEQYGGNSLVAFKYQLEVQLVPYNTTPLMIDYYTNYPVGFENLDPTLLTNQTQVQYLQNNLLEVKLTFRWPLLPNNSTGPNNHIFRSTVSGRLHMAQYEIDPAKTYHLYYLDPLTFTNDSRIGTNAPIFN